jgi:hypothetical protein
MSAGLRIAFRREGQEWVCYIAKTETMSDAARFASINIGAVQSDAAREAWVSAMTIIGKEAIEGIVGVEVLGMERSAAPESEKAGRA